MAVEGAAAFAVGAAMPLSVILFAASEIRAELTVVLVLISLALTYLGGRLFDL